MSALVKNGKRNFSAFGRPQRARVTVQLILQTVPAAGEDVELPIHGHH
jgi:hypothetical protein